MWIPIPNPRPHPNPNHNCNPNPSSYSDLWILAAYVGIEHTGGPAIEFTPGRTDHQDEAYWERMSYGRLPAAEKYCCPHLQGELGQNQDSEGRVLGWEGLCSHVRNEVCGCSP